MKFLIYCCITFCMLFTTQEQSKATITGVYDGYEDDISYEFHYLNDDVLEKYDLKNADWNGKTFTITYTSAVAEQDDEEYEVYTIVDLKEN